MFSISCHSLSWTIYGCSLEYTHTYTLSSSVLNLSLNSNILAKYKVPLKGFSYLPTSMNYSKEHFSLLETASAKTAEEALAACTSHFCVIPINLMGCKGKITAESCSLLCNRALMQFFMFSVESVQIIQEVMLVQHCPWIHSNDNHIVKALTQQLLP